MRKMKSLCSIMFVLGIVFCILGWFQSMPFSADSSVYQYVYMKRIAKSYAFIFFGGSLILFSWIIDKFVDKVNEETKFLYDKISDLERKVDDFNR